VFKSQKHSYFLTTEKERRTEHRWLMPVILAEIRRITVQSQSGKIVHKTLPQKNKTKQKKPQKGLVEWL
jgi:hypothetical protein